PGRRLAPRRGERVQPGGDAGAPVVAEPPSVRFGRTAVERALVLGGGPGERQRQAVDVVEEVAQGVRLARRRRAELAVADAAEQPGQCARRRFEIVHGVPPRSVPHREVVREQYPAWVERERPSTRG